MVKPYAQVGKLHKIHTWPLAPDSFLSSSVPCFLNDLLNDLMNKLATKKLFISSGLRMPTSDFKEQGLTMKSVVQPRY